MTSLSALQYSTASIKTHILTTNSNNKANKDREVIILRKPSAVLPLPKEEIKQDILLTNTARKKSKNDKEVTKVQNPPPLSVARRNARERNRVKQVNNGFANLRQHIPNFIAEAFESGNSRGSNKKLSKVETLRMAVEYIRSLEDLLSLTDVDVSTNAPNIKSPSTSTTSSLLEQPNQTYAYSTVSPSTDEDNLSSVSSPPPHQYVRINGSNSFRIIPLTSSMYEDTENLEPLSVDDDLLSDTALIDTDMEFNGVQDLHLLNSIATNSSLSPEVYSESSLSPRLMESNEAQTFLPIFNTRQITTPLDSETDPKNSSNDRKVISRTIITIPPGQKILQKQEGNISELITWWETQQSSRS